MNGLSALKEEVQGAPNPFQFLRTQQKGVGYEPEKSPQQKT